MCGCTIMMLGGLGLWGKSGRRGAMSLSTCRRAHLNMICIVTLVLTLKSQEACQPFMSSTIVSWIRNPTLFCKSKSEPVLIKVG